MSIPLDNLYHFAESSIPGPATFYLFLPHGSKKIHDLVVFNSYSEEQLHLAPRIICHDQEPLNYDYYTDDKPEMQDRLTLINQVFKDDIGLEKFLYLKNLNLSLSLVQQGLSIYDNPILLHSELNSEELVKYESDGYIGAYWWCHGMIAREWYRYAEHDTRLDIRNIKKLFLIYSRGWTGSREYRLKFIELLIKYGLVEDCQISMLKQESNQTLYSYIFKNRKFDVDDRTMFDVVQACDIDADASADYDFHDIQSTFLSVVLETEFSGSRIHLTEKILRPIACGHPFIVAAGPGTCKVLERYGFKTFNGLINQSYDTETDSIARLEKICQAMLEIKKLSVSELRVWYAKVQEIANYNRTRFFSKDFFNCLATELKENLTNAYNQSLKTQGKNWLTNRKLIRTNKPGNWQQHLYRDNERIKMSKLRKLRLLS